MKKRTAVLLFVLLLLLLAGTAVSAGVGVSYPVLRLKANQSGSVQCIGLIDEILIDPYDGGVEITCRVYVE